MPLRALCRQEDPWPPGGPVPEYPQSLVPVGHVEPAPRRVRAFLGGRTVLDTRSARYVWEWPHYPQYYVPRDDVDTSLLVDERAAEDSGRGTARRHGLQVGEVNRPGAALVYGADAPEALRDPAVRVVGTGRVVRGGRGGLRPPAQPLRAGRRAALHPLRARRARRGRAGRVVVPGAGLRDRPAAALLPAADGGGLQPPGVQPDPDRVPVQGPHERLLVRGDRF